MFRKLRLLLSREIHCASCCLSLTNNGLTRVVLNKDKAHSFFACFETRTQPVSSILQVRVKLRERTIQNELELEELYHTAGEIVTYDVQHYRFIAHENLVYCS